jgi:hypothetical protein
MSTFFSILYLKFDLLTNHITEIDINFLMILISFHSFAIDQKLSLKLGF